MINRILAEPGLLASSPQNSGDIHISLDRKFVPLVWTRQTSSTAVSNTTTETAIFTESINNKEFTNHVWRLVLQGTYLNDSGGPDTFRLRIKYGANPLWNDISPSLDPDAALRVWYLDFILTSKTTTEQELGGHIVMGSAGTPTGAGYGMFDNAAKDFAAPFGGFSAEDTSVDGSKSLVVTVQHTTASPNISLSNLSGLLVRF